MPNQGSLHDLSAPGDVRRRLLQVARAALPAYGMGDADVTLVEVSENATFRVEEPGRVRAALRVHRRGYHSEAQIRSELSWVTELRRSGLVPVPAVMPTLDGAPVATAPDPDGGPRQCVLFEWIEGAHPRPDDLPTLRRLFARLGTITAALHLHAAAWARPAGFARFTWDHDAAFGPRARWGRWQDGIGVGPAEREILDRLDRTLAARLAAYGRAPDRFGLIHADARLANLLVGPDEHVTLIDFDDCGFGWHMYDLAAALSFMEDHPDRGELIDAWLNAYRERHPLSRADEAEVETFVCFRRLLLLAWIGSHRGATDAAALGRDFTTASCELAERYLTRT